jgi:hypothetical protein
MPMLAPLDGERMARCIRVREEEGVSL